MVRITDRFALFIDCCIFQTLAVQVFASDVPSVVSSAIATDPCGWIWRVDFGMKDILMYEIEIGRRARSIYIISDVDRGAWKLRELLNKSMKAMP